MNAPTPRSGQFPWLTISRIPIALWVLLGHTWPYEVASFPEGPFKSAIGQLLSRSGTRVTFFFILSGFILTHVYGMRQGLDRRKFFVARIARLWPLYAFTLLLSLPIFLEQSREILAHHAGLAGWGRLWFRIVTSLSLTQAWHPGAALFWVSVAWSLSCEIFFCMLFPFVAPRLRRFSTPAIWCVLVACLVPMVGRFALYRVTGSFHLNFNPLIRFPEFLSGVCMANLFARGFRIGTWGAWVFAGLALVAGTAPGENLFWFFLIQLAFLGGILAMASLRWGEGSRWIQSLSNFGQLSYGIYLLHAPLAYFLLDRLPKGLLGWMTYLVIVLASSLATYHWIEQPARRWIVDRFGSRSSSALR